jgi:hypothetical protein
MQKMMRMMKGGNQKKLIRQMEAIKGKGGFPGCKAGAVHHENPALPAGLSHALPHPPSTLAAP